MTAVPIIPENAPFTAAQRSWLNGFLAGILSHGAVPAGLNSVKPELQSKRPLMILYGSQSGNAESLAKKIGKEAAARGFRPRVLGLDAAQPENLAKERNVLVITSTWGEGDMPDNAAEFWNGLNQNGSSPALSGVNYSVLALGDTNYADTFCLAGRKLDERLEELGGNRIALRVDCDVEFDEPAKAWSEAVFQSLLGLPDENGGIDAPPVLEPRQQVRETPETFSKKNPFPALLIANIKLNAEGSAKDTRHIAFSLAGSGLSYETGDALGVFVQNCPDVVARIITEHQLDSDAPVALPDGGEAPLCEALQRHYEVRSLLGRTPEKPATPHGFVEELKKLQPRLYSIASSLKAHPGEVHLCVGAVRYELNGISHKGVASTFLADRLVPDETTGVFVHTAKHFRVPTNGDTPIIMVGPGTGIAPFRAFLEERQATGARGKNWLFFGDQKAQADFLYRDQISGFHRDGFLTRLDLAFSRDQAEKVYVQTRMLEHAAELWRWLEEGAHFYVCGDASRMAKDVDAALHSIIQDHGGRSPDEATAYAADLKKTKRYARDVY